MSELLDALETYGADIEDLMYRFMDDENLALECIIQFSKEDGFGRLTTAIESKDYQEAFECAHAIKGVSGNLSLTPLYVAISNLVEPLRNKSYDHVEELFMVVKEEEVKFRILAKQLE